MTKQLEIEIKVGLFVSIGLMLTLTAILVLGSTESLLSRQYVYHTHFPNVSGLVIGAKVDMGGIQVGTVKNITFDEKARDIDISFSVDTTYGNWVRQDSSMEIQTQGVLGDKYLSLVPGSPEQPLLAPKSEVLSHPSQDIAHFLTKGDALMVSLNSIASSLDRMLKTFEQGHRSEIFFEGMSQTAKNLSLMSEKMNHELEGMKLKATVNNLNGIFEKINNGTGTLGELVNDPGLYYDVRALLGGANRNKVLRNLVRDTIKKSEEGSAAETK